MASGTFFLKGKLHFNNPGVAFLLLWLSLSACGAVGPPTAPALPTALLPPPGLAVTHAAPKTPEEAASATLVQTQAAPTGTHSPGPVFTFTPEASLTADPYNQYTLEYLIGRSYGDGEIEGREILAENSYFTRELISYPSDGLTIYGFMDIPKTGTAPYPVVIAIHGYIDPEIYDTIDYTTRYADDLARAGFLVLHPNLRGYPPSENGDNLFRVGMAIDVLNLVALVKDTGGKPGPLEQALPSSIGLWGHSMGGGISTRVMTISPDVKAVVLYGAMSGDEQKNYERIFTYFSSGSRGAEELAVPAETVQRISPINFLERVQAAVSIHHGKQDPDVPLAWSLDLCQRLEALGKTVECFTYPGEGHTFHGAGDELFVQRMIDFFDKYLRGG